ncbi:hypothetical protein MSPP1_002146 [Malassezia sp. CBS 17886]|nr:hypothetical protein MSPP1_002146 [Malassezia sp. CBS 17886]
MASGFGYNGGPSRCFSFWQDFRKCYVMSENPGQCKFQKEDYLECLHHTKELERAHVIQAHEIERQHKESKRAREAGKTGAPGSARLGLISTDPEA